MAFRQFFNKFSKPKEAKAVADNATKIAEDLIDKAYKLAAKKHCPDEALELYAQALKVYSDNAITPNKDLRFNYLEKLSEDFKNVNKALALYNADHCTEAFDLMLSHFPSDPQSPTDLESEVFSLNSIQKNCGNARGMAILGYFHKYHINEAFVSDSNFVNAQDCFNKANNDTDVIATLICKAEAAADFKFLNSDKKAYKLYYSLMEKGLVFAGLALIDMLENPSNSKMLTWKPSFNLAEILAIYAKFPDCFPLQSRLAKHYEDGDKGFPLDHKKSFEIYLRLAEAGHEPSMLKIVKIYHGLDVNFSEKYNNSELAFKWSKRLSQKNIVGMYLLARCYHYGMGVTEDQYEYYRLIDHAAKHNYEPAMKKFWFTSLKYVYEILLKECFSNSLVKKTLYLYELGCHREILDMYGFNYREKISPSDNQPNLQQPYLQYDKMLDRIRHFLSKLTEKHWPVLEDFLDKYPLNDNVLFFEYLFLPKVLQLKVHEKINDLNNKLKTKLIDFFPAVLAGIISEYSIGVYKVLTENVAKPTEKSQSSRDKMLIPGASIHEAKNIKQPIKYTSPRFFNGESIKALDDEEEVLENKAIVVSHKKLIAENNVKEAETKNGSPADSEQTQADGNNLYMDYIDTLAIYENVLTQTSDQPIQLNSVIGEYTKLREQIQKDIKSSEIIHAPRSLTEVQGVMPAPHAFFGGQGMPLSPRAQAHAQRVEETFLLPSQLKMLQDNITKIDTRIESLRNNLQASAGSQSSSTSQSSSRSSAFASK